MQVQISRSQTSTIQDIIYPKTFKPNKESHKKNLYLIRKKQEENRQKKFEKENYIEPKPYKLKQFESIPSKVFTQATEWAEKENKKHPKESLEIKKRPQSSRQITKRSKTYNELEIKEKPIEGLGMFEQYYYDKLKEKNLLKDHCGIYFDEEYQKYQRKEDEALKQIEEEKQKQNVKNIEEQLNEDYEQIKKTKLKEPTPKSTEFGLILPKSQKNFIGENRKLISAKKYVIKGNSQHLEENPFHKNYGKTPSYIEHRKIEAEIQRELEERKRKEAKYPKGTRLLKEEERLKTLQGLQESKRDIINCIERLPITMSSIASQKRKEELEKKLQEVEDAIITFSRKEVFIRVDD